MTPLIRNAGQDLTDNGLIIKGRSKIEAVNAQDAQRVLTTIRTWHCSRLLRRDFNTLTVKMFWACRNSGKRRQIRDLLSDLADEAYVVGRSVAGVKNADVVHTTLTLRVISSEAQVLYDSVMLVDRSLSTLMEAEAPKSATEQCAAFFLNYGRLKEFIFQPSMKKMTGGYSSLPAADLREENLM